MIRRNVEAHAPIHARHLAAGFGREPASAGGLYETRPRGQVEGPAGASLSDVHAPAASLGRVRAPPLGDGRPATVSPQAQSRQERAAIPSLPRPCSVTHPKRCGGVARHFSPPCGAQGYTERADGPALRATRSSRDSAPPPRSRRSPRPVGPHLARPYALGGAPPLCVGIRSGREGVVAVLRRRRCVPPVGPGRPVPRPARARVLARALADSSVACGARAPRKFNACTGPRLFLQM